MPGTGKTTVSRIKSGMGGYYQMIELDEYIETKNKMTLFELIDTYGDDGFKSDRRRCHLSIKFDKPSIVSTGGSVIYSKKGMDHLLSDSLIIYLNTDFDKL